MVSTAQRMLISVICVIAVVRRPLYPSCSRWLCTEPVWRRIGRL